MIILKALKMRYDFTAQNHSNRILVGSQYKKVLDMVLVFQQKS